MGWEDAYHFRPAHRRDLALLRPWLRTEEVMRWWGDPEEQAALLEGDLGEPLMFRDGSNSRMIDQSAR